MIKKSTLRVEKIWQKLVPGYLCNPFKKGSLAQLV
jgi:hypothetical protein